MPPILLNGQFQTILAPFASTQQITTRDRWVSLRNLGANFVQICNITQASGGDINTNTPGTAIAAGNRTSIAPTPLTGARDQVWLKPLNVYLIQAATADTLIACEEIGAPKPSDSGQ